MVLWLSQCSIDGGTGAAAVIQRAFVSQARACLRPLVEIGILGLDAMARELTPCGGGIAPPTFRFHREQGVTLNRTTSAWLE